MTITTRTAKSLLVGVLGVVLWAHPGAAQTTIERKPAKPISSIEGKDSYTAYCAVCHGKDGKGNGPAAPALKGPIPDLTTIATRNSGTFDVVAIQRVISGIDRSIAAHGSADMPIWGPVFGKIQSPETGLLRVDNLARYLESIQEK